MRSTVKRKLLNDLISGKASPFSLVERGREVWREDVKDKPMYEHNVTGQRLHYDELRKRIKLKGKTTDFIIVNYDRHVPVGTPGRLTLNLNNDEKQSNFNKNENEF